MDGVLGVKLEHKIETMARHLTQLAIKQANRTQLSAWELRALKDWPDRLEQLRANPPTDPWEIKDVRWEPSSSLPLKATTTKYGKPDKDETDEQFRRVLRWEQRGISAYVGSPDTVTLLVFEFTIGDYLCMSEWAKNESCDPLNPGDSSSGTAKVKRPNQSRSTKDKSINGAK